MGPVGQTLVSVYRPLVQGEQIRYEKPILMAKNS